MPCRMDLYETYDTSHTCARTRGLSRHHRRQPLHYQSRGGLDDCRHSPVLELPALRKRNMPQCPYPGLRSVGRLSPRLQGEEANARADSAT